MILSQLLTRFGATIPAAVMGAVILIAVPSAHAAQGSSYYKIELAEAAPVKKTIVRGVMFQCEGTTCRAPITGSAPKNVCVSIAKEFGEVRSFQAGERTFGTDEVASCNVKKKVIIARD
jgi:hypothetical protein